MNNIRYISHGDSITYRDGTIDSEGKLIIGYQTVMKRCFDFDEYTNCGWAGKAMADGTRHGDGSVTRVLEHDYKDYNLCTIAVGCNDFRLDVKLGDINSYDRTEFIGAYRVAVEYILYSNPNINLILITPLQRNKDGYDIRHINEAGYRLIDYVNAVKMIGEKYSLPVCDVYSESGFDDTTFDKYTVDGLHPNNVGYEIMGKKISEFILDLSK